MPQFKHYSQSDDIPQIPEGWFFVELNRDRIKIVDNDGNSMMPYTRAMVKKDAMSMALADDGTLVVISEATVSLENYHEPTFHDHASAMAIKMQTASQQSVPKDELDAIRTTPVANPEDIAAKEEQVKKARKKKSAETDAVEQDSPSEQQSSNSEVESSTTDTSTSEEGPSV